MLFKNVHNEVSYYLSGSTNDISSPVYIFHQMIRNSHANVNLIKMNANIVGSSEFSKDDNQKFTVHLDLLGNKDVPFITNKVNVLIHAVLQLGYKFSTGNAQDDFTINNLTLNEVLALIDDPTFQSANILDTYSTWRVFHQID